MASDLQNALGEYRAKITVESSTIKRSDVIMFASVSKATLDEHCGRERNLDWASRTPLDEKSDCDLVVCLAWDRAETRKAMRERFGADVTEIAPTQLPFVVHDIYSFKISEPSAGYKDQIRTHLRNRLAVGVLKEMRQVARAIRSSKNGAEAVAALNEWEAARRMYSDVPCEIADPVSCQALWQWVDELFVHRSTGDLVMYYVGDGWKWRKPEVDEREEIALRLPALKAVL